MKTRIPAFALVLLAGAILSAGYSACSPRVTIVGDKDKPIPINAEIRIHIYQHAASNVDKMMEALDEEMEEEEDETSSMLTRAVMHIVRNIGVSSVYAAEAEKPALTGGQAALKKATKLYRKALPFLKKGLLGENRNGYVQPINKAKDATSREIADAAKMADELNAARKALYDADAAAQCAGIRVVQDAYAKAFREKAKKGTWVEKKKGEKWVWVKK